ncbi:MAG: prepilin-type N-terminal cleavage/methylation domain-containing protein [Planctomycetota bacterium]
MVVSRIYRSTSSTRRGLTLVELMVAIAVISVLAGIALPAVKNTLNEQKVSRAASLVQAAIEEGRARSIAQGGGGGIIIDRVGTKNIAQRCSSIRIRFANSQRNYRGFGTGSSAHYAYLPDGLSIGVEDSERVFSNNELLLNANGPDRLNPSGAASPGNANYDFHLVLFNISAAELQRSADDIQSRSVPTLINLGDKILLGDAGYPLVIQQISRLSTTAPPPVSFWVGPTGVLPGYPTGYVVAEATSIEPNTNLRRFHQSEVTYSIERQPRPAIAMPIELPEGTAIDLTSSGMGGSGNQFSPMAAAGNYLDTTLPPFAVDADPAVVAPPVAGELNYRELYILFGSRGEVSKLITASGAGNDPTLTELPVTGDIHLLVGRAGEVKTDPNEQLEDQDANWLTDESKDGTTPLLNPESVWITIKARTGEVIATPWSDPTDDTTNLRPVAATTPTDATRQARIQRVISRVRSAAVNSFDQGSL